MSRGFHLKTACIIDWKQAIITCGTALEHNFPIESGLTNMGKYFFATKITVISFCDKMASYREAGPLTGRLGLSQGGRASHREAWPLTGRPGLSQEGGLLTERPGLSQGGQPSHREARHLTGYFISFGLGTHDCQTLSPP